MHELIKVTFVNISKIRVLVESNILQCVTIITIIRWMTYKQTDTIKQTDKLFAVKCIWQFLPFPRTPGGVRGGIGGSGGPKFVTFLGATFGF